MENSTSIFQILEEIKATLTNEELFKIGTIVRQTLIAREVLGAKNTKIVALDLNMATKDEMIATRYILTKAIEELDRNGGGRLGQMFKSERLG